MSDDKFHRDMALRGKRAHERLHGQSTWIEAHYEPATKQVRVNDRELGIITRWKVYRGEKGWRIRFEKQIGDRP